jgi:hypothetical protein
MLELMSREFFFAFTKIVISCHQIIWIMGVLKE